MMKKEVWTITEEGKEDFVFILTEENSEEE